MSSFDNISSQTYPSPTPMFGNKNTSKSMKLKEKVLDKYHDTKFYKDNSPCERKFIICSVISLIIFVIGMIIYYYKPSFMLDSDGNRIARRVYALFLIVMIAIVLVFGFGMFYGREDGK